MRKLFVFLGLTLALSVQAQDHAVWLKDSDQLSCSPKTIHRGDTITLELGPDHGSELAVRRETDNTSYFLIISDPPDGVKTLMTPEEFGKKEQIQIPATLITTEWTTGEDVPVFTTNGSYTFFTSVALESEAGGYRCKIRYVNPHGP